MRSVREKGYALSVLWIGMIAAVSIFLSASVPIRAFAEDGEDGESVANIVSGTLREGVAGAMTEESVVSPFPALGESGDVHDALEVKEGVELAPISEFDPQALTPGWEAFGTCEWRIDDSGCLTIRPLGDAEEGILPSLYRAEGVTDTLIPWVNPDGDIFQGLGLTIKSVVIKGKLHAQGSLGMLFYGCRNLLSIEGLENVDTSECDSLYGTFNYCTQLSELDLSSWDVSHVESMSFLFSWTDLHSLTMTGWDTSNVADMSFMFYGAQQLDSFDVGGFDTSHVTNMRGMFFDSSVSDLDLSGFDTSNVTDVALMFSDTSGLHQLDLSGWDTARVLKADSMFDMSSLSEVKVGAAFTLQSQFPSGVWQSTTGATFLPFDIPQGVADAYKRIKSFPSQLGMVISDESLNVVVGCDPLQLYAYDASTGMQPSEWTSDPSDIATVDSSGLVTFHQSGSVIITARFGKSSAKCHIMVDAFQLPATSDSDVKGFVAVGHADAARELAGCNVRMKKNVELMNSATEMEISNALGTDLQLVDVLDIDIIDSDGNVVPWNASQWPISVMMENGYYEAWKSDSVEMFFHHLDSSGVEESFRGDWYRDCGELFFDTTHLSTYAITASGSPAGSAAGTDSASMVGDLAKTGDENLMSVLLLCGIGIVALEVSCVLLIMKRRNRVRS